MMCRVQGHKITLNEKNHFEKNQEGKVKEEQFDPSSDKFFFSSTATERLLEINEFARTWNSLGSVEN